MVQAAKGALLVRKSAALADRRKLSSKIAKQGLEGDLAKGDINKFKANVMFGPARRAF